MHPRGALFGATLATPSPAFPQSDSPPSDGNGTYTSQPGSAAGQLSPGARDFDDFVAGMAEMAMGEGLALTPTSSNGTTTSGASSRPPSQARAGSAPPHSPAGPTGWGGGAFGAPGPNLAAAQASWGRDGLGDGDGGAGAQPAGAQGTARATGAPPGLVQTVPAGLSSVSHPMASNAPLPPTSQPANSSHWSQSGGGGVGAPLPDTLAGLGLSSLAGGGQQYANVGECS